MQNYFVYLPIFAFQHLKYQKFLLEINCSSNYDKLSLVICLLLICTRLESKVDSSCKKPLVICNSIFFIFLNQIKAQRDQKIIVGVEYFPYKYSFKVISND
jgi:hypothetical protein